MMQTRNMLFKILGIWTHGLALFRLQSGREVLYDMYVGQEVRSSEEHRPFPPKMNIP